MNRKLALFAAALLPIALLCAQDQKPLTPAPHEPSPEALRHATEARQQMQQSAIRINELAGHIQTPEDAHKLVDLIAGEFSHELPPKWATRRIRNQIARAEYDSTADPRALIPEQQIADAWNDFVEKIGAPPNTILTAADIHYMRDAGYVSRRLYWARGMQSIWSVPSVYAVGPDGKVANGSRALEAIALLWSLASQTEDFDAIHAATQKGILLSDRIPHPEKPPASGGVGRVGVSAMLIARPVAFPIDVAARQYIRDHGTSSFNHAVEGLLNGLLSEGARTTASTASPSAP
jgi:hypothetical protein